MVQQIHAQGTPGNAGGFEVEGNFLSGDTIAGVSSGIDWSGSNGVLLQSAGVAIPGTDTFQGGFSSWIVDGNWGNGVDNSVFGPSSNKNGDLLWPSPNSQADPWNWQNPGNGPQKNDLTNVFVYNQEDSAANWLVIGAETRATNGTSHLDFEYNQVGVYQTGLSSSGGQLIGNGLHGGRTIGDLLLVVNYVNGGSNPVFSVRRWELDPNPLPNKPQWVWSSPLSINGTDIFITVNQTSIPAIAPGGGFNSNGTASNTTIALQFVEAAINLDALNASPPDPCNYPASVSIKTRTSASYTSELKDFVLVSFPGIPKPVAYAGTDQYACLSTAPSQFTLGGMVQNAASTHWQVIQGSANISDPDSLSTLVTTFSDTVCVELIAAAMDSNCLPARDTVCLFTVPSPTADFSVSGNCANDSVAFTDLSTGTITSYYWDFGDSSTSTLANPMHLYAAADTYQVTLVVSSGNGCADTSTQTLVILPGPTANFSALSSCGADSVIFTNLSTGGAIANYTWDFGDGNTDTTANPVHHYSGPGNYWVTLAVTDSNGCADSISMSVTVNLSPIAAFTTTGGCNGDSVQFVNQSTGSIASYFWDFGDSTTSTLGNPKHLYAVVDTYQVTLIVVDSSGCADTTAQTVIPGGSLVADFSADNVCFNDTMHFVNLTTGSGIAAYLWHFGDSTFSNDENPSHLYASPGAYQVTLVVLDSNACADSVSHTVEMYSRVWAVFSAPSQCDGDSVRFVNLSSPGSVPIVSYYWDFDDGTTDSVSFAPVHLYPGPGSYWAELLVVDSLGCSDWSTARIRVFPNPTCGIQPPDSLPRCGSQGNTLQADSLTQTIAASYQWVIQSLSSSSWDTVGVSTGPVLTYNAGSDSALFILTVTDSNGCQSVCSLQVNCTSNRPPMSPGGGYVAHRGFPNPFTLQATIEFMSTVSTAVKVEVFDVMGARVGLLFNGVVQANQIESATLDGNGLSEGLYFYRIQTETGSYLGKLIYSD